MVTVAIGSGGAIAVLVQSLFAWLTNHKTTQIHLRITREDGREVEVCFNGAHDLNAVIDKLLKFVGDSEKPA